MNPNEETGGVWWVYLFLLRTFFGACRSHNALNNHENQYCISCEMAACQHCLAEGSHVNHTVITIYRLVYMDVVSLDEMNRHLDCSRIQPYTSNGRLVVALSPLPHHGSGSLKRHLACQYCARRLMDPSRYRFCSIACKFRVTTGKPTTKPKPVRSPLNSGPAGGAANVHQKKSLRGTGRRKGIPVRAPFY